MKHPSRGFLSVAGVVLLAGASVAAYVAVRSATVRHEIVTLATSVARVAGLHPPPAPDGTIAVAAVPHPLAPGLVMQDDGRFAQWPAAQTAAPLGQVLASGSGFIAMPAQPQSRDAGLRSDEMERASLTLPAGGDTVAPTVTAADFGTAHQAIALYRKGSVAPGDEFAKTIADPLLRTAVEWVALRFAPREAGLIRLKAFTAVHADWPTLPWLKRRIEEISISNLRDPVGVEAWFGSAEPQTLVGRLALARAEIAQGEMIDGVARVRHIWRQEDFSTTEETDILKEFGPLLGSADHKYRADRLLYKEQVGPALRAAALAGPEIKLLAQARASVIGQGAVAAMNAALAAVPKPLADDPGLIFSRIQKARRAGNSQEAVELMDRADTDPQRLISGDDWWVERRLLARKLLDMGDPRGAYRLCAGHTAASDATVIEAEFHAGWIALRFLNEPATAATHFAKAAALAETPISRARVAYWQGRAAESAGNTVGAASFYNEAAAQPISFYGQLAGSRLGRDTIALRQPVSIATGDERNEAIRVVEQLYMIGERDIALPLALEIARTNTSDAQVAALAAILSRAADARGTLLVGKYATQRGLALDETAFPIFGIPGYQPLQNSADRAVVYAIARQESEFDPRSTSAAGAKGLMQLINATARITANKLGVSYDDARLVNDAAFNAQIGAAHLGQLLAEQRGSYILTFAAYNAGSGRVKEWIDAYGDPRKPGVDPVDWIERIPFTETRNYVQRVFENLQVYRHRFNETDKLLVDADLGQRKGT
ncbi:transglycosylase SLT domain-containing protein [Lichenifustis flavocetrariae]|uniref:Transglycosylase SLT domain-containing protein n=1 Tax=Lichenifustis flavocetrariae TaxID=2949735 RepID=A0AA41Z0K5_9HYPH|nr:transglycosylase SLT domain-containing protein [Lichenifustis flavocetrariae]MCW6510717.1 transglycosylase SLT domain-containing protein [Lichenifustis flavocetrariae]